ncbi:MAG: HEAT repeat domain-containing protein [Candidatus Promineifilaceae bacterium]|nr:HEAT repeat domain-containing protein [Candidatus Promineifilaceae bacterium]
MDDQLSFPAALERLFDEERVSLSLLYRLSDMTPGEIDHFAARWPEQSDERRRVIARHLADISEENFVVDFSPVFRQLLEDASPAVRLAALDGLWDTTNTAVVSPILERMQKDPDERVRASAAATLGHFVLMGEWGQINKRVAERIVEALLAQIDKEEVADAVRRAVLESLSGAAHPRVPELIDSAYRHGGEAMRASAVFAMGRSADPRWAPIVLDEMMSPQMEMRIEAARAAGSIGQSDFVHRLAELVADDDLEVQLAAVTSLGQIGSEEAYEILRRIAADPDFEYLATAAEEAIEEIEWLGGELDLSLFDWDDDEAT